MSELLAPAGSFEIAKLALYNGADALYLATSNYGARAYAKNLTLDELDDLLNICHSLKKKVYVTVNTIIKEDELSDCYEYIKTLYNMGVDGIICTDLAIISFIINNCENMEAHISTQVGVKDIYDVLFFQNYGAKRCVLARENSIEEIKYIKENTKMQLEVFIHGALCVSYSGGCLISSLLNSRSGNRGRCSQNCRREYKLKQDNKIITNNLALLSMKDLNTIDNINEFVNLNIDSLKIEGRMKNEAYVSLTTRNYRNKIDNSNYNSKSLDKVFHRVYTKGFINNEDKGTIVNSNNLNNMGEFIGTVINQKKSTHIFLKHTVKKGDKLRFDNFDESIYYTVDKIFNSKNNEVSEGINNVYLNIPFKLKENTKIYRILDQNINNIKIDNRFKKGIDLYLYAKSNEKLNATVYFDEYVINLSSNALLENASNKPLTSESLFQQFNKLNDTPFYINEFNTEIIDDCFMSIKEINELRRNIIKSIYETYRTKRVFKANNISNYNFVSTNKKELICFCYTLEQYLACKESNIKTIFYKNYSPYVNSTYPENDDILIGNYGGLYKYQNKEITCDYSFNVTNSAALYELFKSGASNVTYSYELSHLEIKNIYSSFVKKYNTTPNTDLIIYGKQNLMTLKYCPIKHIGKCPSCKDFKYSLLDNNGEFPLIHVGCTTHVLNGLNLNIIDELHLYYNYANRFRIQFTTESKEECKKIIENARYKLSHLDEKTSFFDSTIDTRGYFKRPIL